MKVSVLQENLLKALSSSVRIVGNKPQIPILSHVLLKAGKQGLEIQATNLELGWRGWVGASVLEEGQITVPVKTFFELVSNLGTGKMDLVVENTQLKIASSGVKASVNGSLAEEFPVLPSFEKDEAMFFDSEIIKNLIEKSVFASAIDESRPVLTGVLIKISDDKIEFVGTDGFRLSQVVSDNKVEIGNKELLIPAKSLQELSRVIDDQIKEIGVHIVEDSNQVIFLAGEVELSTRLISGNFPDYKKILPDNGEIMAEMAKDDLIRAIKLASVFARGSANIVKLEITKGAVIVSANAAQVGDNEVIVDAKTSGEVVMAFNFRYILDFLNVLEDNSVVLKSNGSLSASLWLGKDIEDYNFKHVIMPVRVED